VLATGAPFTGLVVPASVKEVVLVSVRRVCWFVFFSLTVALSLDFNPVAASGPNPPLDTGRRWSGVEASLYSGRLGSRIQSLLSVTRPDREPEAEYRVRLAYGRTFGTSTELDYTTIELSKRMSEYPTLVFRGSAKGEVQLAFLASHVSYKGGKIERLKKLDFRDGYELGFMPKGRFTLAAGVGGLIPYLESGAGIGYVSETYRNSGSRWNWSLLGGIGMEGSLPGPMVVSLGVQWRHLSNGNMWGEGDELHNSNSGTDMVQGLATIVHRF